MVISVWLVNWWWWGGGSDILYEYPSFSICGFLLLSNFPPLIPYSMSGKYIFTKLSNISFLWKVGSFAVFMPNCGSFLQLLILISACSDFPLFLKPGEKPLTCFSSCWWCIPPQLTLIKNLSSSQMCSAVVRVPRSRSYFKLTTRSPLDIV